MKPKYRIYNVGKINGRKCYEFWQICIWEFEGFWFKSKYIATLFDNGETQHIGKY